ncbi:TPM domain-containing protein [Microbacterium amylolyticum]|uniref:Phosphoribosylanthranilate isomerase n=1 Tax=Microbacterium amylolyticum TaxID=936337 RepID=A0ABS4ZG62_9MICO|nr:TPM domain-containing protein [Microbacterium amylolyticum]MBP2436265.1 phosphoribosylanthranilate isomerase [Microbacterium amylolyticum]
MRRRARTLSSVALAAALVLAPAVGAVAQPVSSSDPVLLDSGYVTDDAGVLTSAEIEAANHRLDQLRADDDVELWVVYVDHFTNPSDSAEWTHTTAEMAGLGSDQYLLAIATEGRQIFLSGPGADGLSTGALSAVEQAATDPLRGNDWAGAATAAADEISAQLAPNRTGLWAFLIVVIVVAGTIAVVIVVRRAKKKGAAQRQLAEETAEVEELEKSAAVLLVASDDALRSSQQELGFAIAQFGSEATAEYEQAIGEARLAVGRAFETKSRFDAIAEPSLAQRREAGEQIIALLEEANETLSEKEEAFEKLRALEQNAPAMLAQLRTQRQRAASGPDEADAEIGRLRTSYASPVLGDVSDNADEARDRLDFADDQLAQAEQMLAQNESGQAAVALDHAQQALAQADELVSAVTSLRTAFAEAEQRARDIIADLEKDLVQAQTIADPDGAIGRATAEASKNIGVARENLTGSERKPFLMVQALDAANDQLDAVLARAREAEENARRQRQQFDQSVHQARSQISQAERYIGTRRGAVGSSARTLLASAQASLDRAFTLSTSNMPHALAAAQNAAQLAQQASTAARNDVNRYQSHGGYSSGGHRPRSSAGSNIAGAIIGGLIGGAISGGGNSRGSTGFGGFSGGGSRGGGGGRSFGGGGRSGGGGRRF